MNIFAYINKSTCWFVPSLRLRVSVPLRLVISTAIGLALITGATAQVRRAMSPADILRIAAVSDAQISPNGEWIVYTVSSTKVIRLVHLSGSLECNPIKIAIHPRVVRRRLLLHRVSIAIGPKFGGNQFNCCPRVGVHQVPVGHLMVPR